MFVKDNVGGYTNTDHVSGAWALEDSPGVWKIQLSLAGSTAMPILAGSWSSQAACQEAIRELFDGVDPSTYGD